PDILHHFPMVKLLLVGRDRGYRASLESIASSLMIRDKVIFTGEREDIPELLKAMDVGTLCSLYSEGFSNAVLEMMAAGLPVVATDVGGNREAILDGQTGLLVPPGDSSKLAEAILRLLQDKELASRMGAAAHERVRSLFSMERMIEETEQLYTELVRAKSPTAARYVR
ncbi:MAG: glycosyltransferase family 4 protein, partial [Chloroflexota bacterium]|nr:glycosyltransferase family 4 protein [Chloroflexota bacterium]